MQDNAENALEAATEPEGELEETKPGLDADTPTVCHPAFLFTPLRFNNHVCLLPVCGTPVHISTLAATLQSGELFRSGPGAWRGG